MTSWLDHMKSIAEDFKDAEVRQFFFKSVRGHTTCVVVVRNADKELVTWELVDDGVSTDRWQKVFTRSES
jgi:hypothetical protein